MTFVTKFNIGETVYFIKNSMITSLQILAVRIDYGMTTIKVGNPSNKENLEPVDSIKYIAANKTEVLQEDAFTTKKLAGNAWLISQGVIDENSSN